MPSCEAVPLHVFQNASMISSSDWIVRAVDRAIPETIRLRQSRSSRGSSHNKCSPISDSVMHIMNSSTIINELGLSPAAAKARMPSWICGESLVRTNLVYSRLCYDIKSGTECHSTDRSAPLVQPTQTVHGKASGAIDTGASYQEAVVLTVQPAPPNSIGRLTTTVW